MNKRKRLLWQIYPSYLLITILALVAVSWFASGSLKKFFHGTTSADLASRAALVKNSIQDPLFHSDYGQVDRICKAGGRESDTRITVVLPSGRVVGDSHDTPAEMEDHSDRPEVVKALDGRQGTAIRFSNTLGLNMMYVAIPIERENAVRAVVRTSVSISSIGDELRTIRFRIFTEGVFIALVAAWVSLYISRRISSPIEDMKRGAELFAMGDFSRKLYVPDTEEIGGLAEAMNHMAGELDERIKTTTRQRNELEAVLSSMDEGVAAIDEEGIIISINRSAAAFLGIGAEELYNRSLFDVVRNIEFQNFYNRASSAADACQSDIKLYEFKGRILHIRSTPLRDAANQRIGTLIVFNDVTRLRQLENMRRDFAANVSHEIKTPLTSIKGSVETILSESDGISEGNIRFLNIIDKNVERLIALIEDLLKLSRIERDDENQNTLLTTGRLSDVLDSALQACSLSAVSRNVAVDVSCPADLTARIDASLMEQAAVNLLDNAIKYSDEGGRVTVTAEAREQDILISFTDNGPGIDSSHFARLFERFYRVDKARSRKLGGTGLGLSIVKHIMQVHNGDVSVESTPGKGSTFRLHLPKELAV